MYVFKSKMISTIFKLCVVFAIVSPTLQEQSARKYSVEQEALKLYGQDLKTVLKRFRRTPDYLKILQDKMHDLKSSTKEISLQILHFYHGKMDERINEILPTTTTTTAPLYEREGQDKSSFHDHSNRRQDYEDGETSTKPPQEETSEMKIRNLDNYKTFFSPLSVAEKNSMRDLGFEIAGEIIHKIFKHLTPTGSKTEKVRQTESPEERGVKVTTTSEHPGQHEVSHQTESSTQDQQTESVTTSEYFPGSTVAPDDARFRNQLQGIKSLQLKKRDKHEKVAKHFFNQLYSLV